MKIKEFYYPSADQVHSIHAVIYEPQKEIKAILQIVHGMAEFFMRYEPFGEYLCSKGILVCGNDHLGHGNSISSYDELGYFSKRGREDVLADIHHLHDLMKESYPDVPYFLMGHSMGSFLARNYLFTYENDLKGVIIMGTGYQSPPALDIALALTKILTLFKGERYRSAFINNLAMGSYGKSFRFENRKSAWISKDTSVVDRYDEDDKCGFVFTLNGFSLLFSLIREIEKPSLLKKMDQDLPVFFVSGKKDPVGNYTKGVMQTINAFQKAGMKHISYRFYENDRHEILNETDKMTVYEDLYDFIDRNI